jgi:hypothetical protein
MVREDDEVVKDWSDKDIEDHIYRAEKELKKAGAWLTVLKAERAGRAAARQKELREMKCKGLPLDHPAHIWPVFFGHNYPSDDYTSDCMNGCRCWMGPARSGGPNGVDPFGPCPQAPPNTNVRRCEKCLAAFPPNNEVVA